MPRFQKISYIEFLPQSTTPLDDTDAFIFHDTADANAPVDDPVEAEILHVDAASDPFFRTSRPRPANGRCD